MTCVIVTHEMSFAKAVSSQVIYMDEKGIYEMGPPAQIFDAPKRERTRAFINRLKTFQRTITDRNFDIYGLNGAVVEFCRRQFASEKQIYRVQLVLEELLVNIMLPQMKGGADCHRRDRGVQYEGQHSVGLRRRGPGFLSGGAGRGTTSPWLCFGRSAPTSSGRAAALGCSSSPSPRPGG